MIAEPNEHKREPTSAITDEVPGTTGAPALAHFTNRIPHEFARRHLVLADRGDSDAAEQRLRIGPRADPCAVFNVGVRLERALDVVVVDDEEALAREIDEAYGVNGRRSSSWAEVMSTAETDSTPSGATEVRRILEVADRDLLVSGGKAPVARLVDALLFEALGLDASDMHVQPLADRTIVRYRVDGALHERHELPASLAAAVVSRVKVMGRMDVSERRVPQDGRATVTIGERPIDLRISTLPTSYGERAVVRLLDHRRQLCDFNRLGMPREIAAAFLGAAERSSGIVLVTGPTGSGKTTTLYSALRRLATPDRNLMTIEDPIEYELSTVGLTISQAQVNRKKGVTFATGLRSVLRQDPDVIMVGEIRDAETVRIAIQSSLTGHLVFSTLHTNDAPSAVTRLVDLGVEPYLVGASLSAALAQRLVRLTHDACGGAGCTACLGSGLKGRTGIFELLVVDEPVRELISEGAPLGRLRAAAAAGGTRRLRDEGDRLVRAGRTPRAEVDRVLGLEDAGRDARTLTSPTTTGGTGGEA